MPGQHMLEAVIEQALHRPDLLAPRVPAGVAECIEMTAALAPGEVIAGEEKLLAIEKHRMPFGVAGRGNHQQVICDRNGIRTTWFDFNSRRARSHIIGVKHTLTTEAFVELRVISNVVLMSKQHPTDTAKAGDVPNERARKARRIDEHVSVVATDEVTDR